MVVAQGGVVEEDKANELIIDGQGDSNILKKILRLASEHGRESNLLLIDFNESAEDIFNIEILNSLDGFKAQALIARTSLDSIKDPNLALDRGALVEAHKKINSKHCKIFDYFLNEFNISSYIDIDNKELSKWLSNKPKSLCYTHHGKNDVVVPLDDNKIHLTISHQIDDYKVWNINSKTLCNKSVDGVYGQTKLDSNVQEIENELVRMNEGTLCPECRSSHEKYIKNNLTK